MEKYLMLSSSNIKKSKSQMLTIIALILIATIFLNIWLVIAIDYSKNYDNRAVELNSEDALVIFKDNSSEIKDICKSVLDENDSVVEYNIYESIYESLTIKFSVGTLSCNFTFIDHNEAKNKQIGKYKFLDSTENFAENTVFLPYLFSTSGGYKIGDTLEVNIEETKYVLVVGGFFESMMEGSMNGGVVSLVVHEKTMQSLRENSDICSTNIAVKLNSSTDKQKFVSRFVEEVSMQKLALSFSLTSDVSEQARTFIANIIGGILALIAFLISVISLIVIGFNISNKIEEDMKNLGVLKGIGYKSKQIIFSILMQFLMIAIAACIVGIALSYAVIPVIANLFVMQTGIVWSFGFSLFSALITFFAIGIIVTLVTVLTSFKIRKITPMTALRDGIETHNFKKNILEIEKTKLNLHVALSIKSVCKNIKQNVAIAIILALLSIVGVFAGAIYENIVVNSDGFMKAIIGESADIEVLTQYNDGDEVLTALKGTEGVKKAYEYSNSTVYVFDTNIKCYVSDSFDNLNNKSICYEGRLPKHQNEIAIGGNFANQNKLGIGDMINVRFNKSESAFLITGFTQSTNYMGFDCMMTNDAFEKIGDLLQKSYFINVEEGTDADALILKLKEQQPDKILLIVNVREATNSLSKVYVDLMSIISLASIIIMLFVIFTVLFLMVKTYILKKRKEFGIYKALGYTTRQLVMQTIISFLPTVIIGVVIGSILGLFLMNPFFTIILSSVGILKSMFSLSPIVIVLIAAGIILFSLCVTLLVSQRIRKVSAIKMLLNN